jgi:hypothetical protein
VRTALAILAALALPAAALAEGADAGVPRTEAGAAPDPEPSVSSRELTLDIAWEKGSPVLVKATPRTLASPRKAGRFMGRFALELTEGPALLERVRFNFPLMHEAPPNRADYKAPPSFEGGLTTTVRVVFPQLERGVRFELVDRATGRRWSMPWPIEAERGRTTMPLVSAAAVKSEGPPASKPEATPGDAPPR